MVIEYDHIRTSGPAFGRGKVEAGIYYHPRLQDFAVVIGAERYGTYDTLEQARARLAEVRAITSPGKAPKRVGTKNRPKNIGRLDGLEHCLKCKYHAGSGVKGDKSKTSPVHCNYLEITGISRVANHYKRIGRESLDGFTHGKNCPEFEPIQKRGASNG